MTLAACNSCGARGELVDRERGNTRIYKTWVQTERGDVHASYAGTDRDQEPWVSTTCVIVNREGEYR